MTNTGDIIIQEKPVNVSWDDIKDCLHVAHLDNYNKGIVMQHQGLTGDEIKELLGNEGQMFVALSNDRVVGTAAIKPKETSFWFGRSLFAYFCFAGIIPEYKGEGLYKCFNVKREKYAQSLGIDKLMFNTHPRNKRVIDVALRSGYKLVRYSKFDIFSYVYLVKWLNGCPYSDYRCRYEYLKSKYIALTKYYIKRIIGKIGISIKREKP